MFLQANDDFEIRIDIKMPFDGFIASVSAFLLDLEVSTVVMSLRINWHPSNLGMHM